MNFRLKNFFLPLAIITFSLSSASCQNSKEKEYVQFVVQPEMEIGKSYNFYIQFIDKPDSIWATSNEINGLELTNNLNSVLENITESNITDDSDKVVQSFYSFYTYAKPTKKGRIDFPVLTVRIKGKEYSTKAFSVNVVDKTEIGPDAVKLIWSTDKDKYQMKDSINVSLYEYSKFSQTKRSHSSAKNLSLNGKNNEISIGVEESMDNLAGIDDFEKSIDSVFNIEDYDWNMFNTRQSIEKINNINYIKRLILSLTLAPKEKGEFTIGPSEYDYRIYKSNDEYFSGFVPNKNGSYKITDNGSIKKKVKSNYIKFKVE